MTACNSKCTGIVGSDCTTLYLYYMKILRTRKERTKNRKKGLQPRRESERNKERTNGGDVGKENGRKTFANGLSQVYRKSNH